MQPQTYKLYVQSSPGSGYFDIARLANPVPGYQEVTPQQAQQLAQQHAQLLNQARASGGNSSLNGMSDGDQWLAQMNQVIGNPGEAYYQSYTNPITGEVMHNVSQSTVNEITQQQADLAAGRIRQIAPGMFVPTGSAADVASQGGTGAGNTVITNPTGQYGQTGGAVGTSGASGANANNNPTGGFSIGANGAITINGQTFDTGNAQTNEALAAMWQNIQQQNAAGNVINPDLQLTPEVLQQFLDYATNQIHPQYAQQIAGVKDDLVRNADYLRQKYNNDVANSESQFTNALGSNREEWAGSGTAFSGGRAKSELGMQDQQNRSLDLNALGYNNNLTDMARTAEKQVGSANMTGFQLPTFQKYSASLGGASGGFQAGASTQPQYTPGSFNLGSIPAEEQSQILQRQQSLVDKAYTNAQYGRSWRDLLN